MRIASALPNLKTEYNKKIQSVIIALDFYLFVIKNSICQSFINLYRVGNEFFLYHKCLLLCRSKKRQRHKVRIFVAYIKYNLIAAVGFLYAYLIFPFVGFSCYNFLASLYASLSYRQRVNPFQSTQPRLRLAFSYIAYRLRFLLLYRI